MKKSKFQIKGIPKITSFKFEANSEFKFRQDLNLEVEIKSTHNVKKIDNYNAIVTLEMEIFPESRNDKPFYLEIKGDAKFTWGEDLPKDVVESLLMTNSPAIILSYMRPIISQLTTYAGQAPLIIPLLDLSKE